MKLSVVIPTYNRLDNLLVCLEALGRQSLPREFFEIIVVDDGSDKSCQKEVEAFFRRQGVFGRYYRQTNAGPAVARNQGVKMASGEAVVFIGDDMVVADGFLSAHYDFHLTHQEETSALLGLVQWPPSWPKTDFVDWLDKTCFQFDFISLSAGQEADYKHFYTSNISLKKSFLLANGLFNESFPYAAFEDTELGYRLQKKGLKLIYDPKALVHHYHKLTFSDYLSRMEKAGASAAILCGLHPEIKSEFMAEKSLPVVLKDLIKRSIALAGQILGRPRWYYKSRLLDSYSYGYQRQQKNIRHHP